MLRISKKADYAVFLLGYLARRGACPGGSAADSVVSAQEISRQAGLNKSVVANLLKEFTKEGVLDSVRGLKGGYRLVISPHDLTLARILEVVDGPFTLVDCIKHGEQAELDDDELDNDNEFEDDDSDIDNDNDAEDDSDPDIDE